ncbi:hypothetical protein GS501_02385 [Saccharibacter sp. 17.LH.SD]|uniref:phage GP46 family protein n=1 Tax=Saccharibacter sp. 17.LH.SD TaxID=2689393 RepID=UPI001369AD1E|nr:phage GP46 family protein [Saccharibacter sp. 17.LH.SD]MXV43900.1 hypothetical protein [Saccharibacter sp. 17.LH.SD]
MTQRPTIATIQFSPINGQTDLVITSTGSGRGRVSFDQSLASPLMLAIGSDRRAAPDDTVPPQMTPLFGAARRGWVGDVLLSVGQRHGSRLWLLERAKRTEATRLAAEDYTNEAVAAIATYHNVEMAVSAAWQHNPSPGLQGVLRINVKAAGTSVTQQVVL